MRWRRPRLGFWLRLAAMSLLAMLAIVLPRRVAFACARVAGKLDARVTRRGRVIQAEFARSYGLAARPARDAASAWYANEYVDVVGTARVATGRERPDDKELLRFRRETDPATLSMILDERSLMVGLGHFGNATTLKLLALAVAVHDAQQRPHTIAVMRVASPGGTGPRARIDGLFRRLQDRAFAQLRGRWTNIEVLEVGDRNVSSTRRLLELLRSGSATVTILIDAPWRGPAVHYRPFAGWARAGFSASPMRLARTAGCSVATAVPSGIDSRDWHVDVGAPIDPADYASDAAALDALLDRLETIVADRPTEYRVRPKRGDWRRRWDPVRRRWEPARDRATVDAL